MKKISTISTVIDAGVKKAATDFCKKNGLKLQYLIETALIDTLEDVIDLEAYRKRKGEETVSFETILSGIKK